LRVNIGPWNTLANMQPILPDLPALLANGNDSGQ